MRLPTGSVTTRVDRHGETVFSLRFRAYGKRRWLTLGSESEGWTEAGAFQRLEEVLDQVAAKTWAPDDIDGVEALHDLIRNVLDTTDANDPQDIAAVVVEHASEDTLRAELESMVADRVRSVMHSRRTTQADILDGRYNVPKAGWKRFRDCTRTDVALLAADYERQADEMRDRAAAMHAVGRAMTKYKVAVVGELSTEVLERSMVTVRRSPAEARKAKDRALERAKLQVAA